MNNMRTRNLIAGIILLVLCAGYAWLTSTLPSRAIDNTTQPSFFPSIISVCLAVLAISLFIQGILPRFNGETPAPTNVSTQRLLISFGLAIIYLLALPTLGFLVANIPLFAGLMYLYGERRPLWIAISSLLISIIVFFLFRELFQILLPAGLLKGII